MFPKHGDVYERGPDGGNIFHFAVSLNNPSSLSIARYLAQLYGKTLINCPHQTRYRQVYRYKHSCTHTEKITHT